MEVSRMQRCVTSSGGRKGFYFSFDAIIAFTVIAASLAIVSQSSMLASDSFDVSTVSYQKANLEGEDAMKMASRQDFNYFNDSFRQELMDNKVMDENDLDRNIVDGVTLLWAARNFTYASDVAERYLDSRIPDRYGYRLEVNNNGQQNTIYQTSETPEDASSVTSISRLVSGHQIDRPSEGFQARARAVKSEANRTKVVNIPMMGSGGENLALQLDKKFKVNASDIQSAKIYFSAHWGQSNFQSNEVQLNGQSLDIGGSNADDWDHYAEKEGTTLGYDTADVTEEVQEGWNNFYLNFNNQNNHHVHIHPGTRIEITYSGEDIFQPEDNREYFANIQGEAQNRNKKGGAWITKPFYIPENATVENVSTRVNVEGLRDVPGRSDLEAYLNSEKVYAENLSGSAIREINLTEEVEKGNNVLSIYANTFVDEGEVTGFGGYPGDPTIYSDPENNPETSSSLYLDYESPDSGLIYNRLELTTSEEIGGLPENPKTFSKEFREDVQLSSVFINLAQLDSRNVTLQAGDSMETVFQSPRDYATPTKIGVERDLISNGALNEFKISEECSQSCSVLPETSLEKHVLVPSQVGYGGLFSNKSDAVEDAEERLQEQLGDYAEATEVDSDTLSTGNQPYLWGPASFRLVVWHE
jgi:hypothetical protein